MNRKPVYCRRAPDWKKVFVGWQIIGPNQKFLSISRTEYPLDEKPSLTERNRQNDIESKKLRAELKGFMA